MPNINKYDQVESVQNATPEWKSLDENSLTYGSHHKIFLLIILMIFNYFTELIGKR